MAKLSVAVLFVLFTISVARTPLTQPVDDVTNLKLPLENDVTNLKLPLENDVIIPEVPKTLPESDDSLPTVRSIHPMPLNFVRFRPINRRFRLRSNLPFKLCNHMKAESRRQFLFGNDMVLSSKRNIDFDKFVYRIGVSQIPSDRFDFRRQKYNDEKIWKFLDDREKIGEMKFKDQSPYHHDDHRDESNYHQQRKIWKFLDDSEKFREMKLKDQLFHYHHHHDEDNEDNDHQQKSKISKFQNQFRANHDDEADKRSKLYGKHYEMKLRKRFRYNAGEEEGEKAEEETKWHKKEKKKGGFMRGIRKFLHNYFD